MFYRTLFRLARWLALPPSGQALETDDAKMHGNDRQRDPLQSLGQGPHRPTQVRSSRKRVKGRRTTG